MDEFSLPSTIERDLVAALLSVEFPGVHELRSQASDIRVCALDKERSFKIMAGSAPNADVIRRIPIEAVATDLDGVRIHVLLHVVAGRLDEVEIFREDSKSLHEPVRAEMLTTVLY